MCCPHISITVPFPRAVSSSNLNEIRSVVLGIKPFIIQYGPLVNYLPAPGVYLAIEPGDMLEGLRAALESTSAFRGAMPRKRPFSPHMTIAEFITDDRTLELMNTLKDKTPSGSFLCTNISYMVPNDFFRFTEIWRFNLA